MSNQRIGKYACLEIERRYLLQQLPADLDLNGSGWLITDRYIPNTRLRLRCMQSLIDDAVLYKFTQKYQTPEQEATQTTITNMYLTEAEYSLLVSLDAEVLEKKRYRYESEHHRFSIDVFQGRHQGLILAEIEFETDEEAEINNPSFAFKDVTDDPFFTGGNLIAVSDDIFRQSLANYFG